MATIDGQYDFPDVLLKFLRRVNSETVQVTTQSRSIAVRLPDRSFKCHKVDKEVTLEERSDHSNDAQFRKTVDVVTNLLNASGKTHGIRKGKFENLYMAQWSGVTLPDLVAYESESQ